MKILAPTPLLAEAADVLTPVLEYVVVVGAAALEIALADTTSIAITPTRDVDLVVAVEHAAQVVAHLEAADLQRSNVPHERGFTWVRGDLKVQLVRTFHPFPKPPARALPQNSAFTAAARPTHQLTVAFPEHPATPRLRCVNAACLLALKQAAFGRTRPPEKTPVERDFHDAYLLISAAQEAVLADLQTADYEVRHGVSAAVSQLAAGHNATAAAARQMVLLHTADSLREAEAAVRRAALRLRQRLDKAGL
jgi:hypothetical protein